MAVNVSADISQLRQTAHTIFQAGVAAADPCLAVKRNLTKVNNALYLRCQDQAHSRTGTWSTIHLIAFGKGACPMLRAALEVIGSDYPLGGVIAITNYENVQQIPGVEVLGAGHPLPDESGLVAARTCAQIAENAQDGELVLVLISGGGSALLPCPVSPVSLLDKINTTGLLLASGATINEINCVRKHLSRLKGGGLARLTKPAALHALILSDVLGDDVSAIASGPTVADQSTFIDAVNLLKHKSLWHEIPENVRRYLEQGVQGNHPDTLKIGDDALNDTDYTVIGSNLISVKAITQAARDLGFETVLFNNHLCGEASEQALNLLTFAKNRIKQGLNKPLAILAGGETTVTLKGTGKGGRNQEMALAFALYATQQDLPGNWVFLSGGTDGRDGPTEAAGGIVDSGTIARINAAGFNAEAMLANNNSNTALNAAHDLLITGATGTNVADLQVLLLSA